MSMSITMMNIAIATMKRKNRNVIMNTTLGMKRSIAAAATEPMMTRKRKVLNTFMSIMMSTVIAVTIITMSTTMTIIMKGIAVAVMTMMLMKFLTVLG